MVRLCLHESNAGFSSDNNNQSDTVLPWTTVIIRGYLRTE